MRLRFFDDGEAVLTALGAEYNYAVISDYPRGWRVEQTWYREDLRTTLLLKGTWMPDAAQAVDLCQAWEDGYEKVNQMDRTRMGRMKRAAMATRERRQAIRERAHHER